MAIPARVQSYLDVAGVSYEVVAHPYAESALASAQAAHISGERVAKGVLLETGNRYLVALLPATRHIDLGALHRRFGQLWGLATEQEIGDVFPDCATGAAPAAPAAYDVDAVVDDSLLETVDMYLEAGDHASLIHLGRQEFEKLVGDAPHGHFSHHV
jgi:Ala-tRNA(Pro) deacylase